MTPRPARRARPADPRGSILPLMLVCVVALVLVGLACVDVAGAYVARARGRGVAQVASSETSAHTLRVKTSEDPLNTIANMVSYSLASNGFSGEYTMRVYEASAPELDALGMDPGHDRLIGVSVDFGEAYEPLVRFDLMGFDLFARDLTIPVHKAWVIHPFASAGTIYRPPSTGYGGEYRVTCDGSGAVTSTTLVTGYPSLSDAAVPADLRSAILVEAGHSPA